MLKHIYRDSDDTNHTVNAIFILLLLRVDHTHTYNNKDVPRICILWYDKDMKQPYLNVTLCEVWVNEKHIVMDRCMLFWIKAPQWCAWQKQKQKNGAGGGGGGGGGGFRKKACLVVLEADFLSACSVHSSSPSSILDFIFCRKLVCSLPQVSVADGIWPQILRILTRQLLLKKICTFFMVVSVVQHVSAPYNKTDFIWSWTAWSSW